MMNRYLDRIRKRNTTEYEIRGYFHANACYWSDPHGDDLQRAKSVFNKMIMDDRGWDHDFEEIVILKRTMTWERDQVGEDILMKKFKFNILPKNYMVNNGKVMEQIIILNDILLEPDKMAWGDITREEADDAFNDVTNPLHEEWGTKSFNLLHWISDMDDWY
tara:strand:- start:835 stop:1320 length:486 start_codon:yes stop_codon:yes gene_type:complete